VLAGHARCDPAIALRRNSANQRSAPSFRELGLELRDPTARQITLLERGKEQLATGGVAGQPAEAAQLLVF
jgi:hypothetical protein